MHSDNQVTGVQLVTLRQDKEAITGAFPTILRIVFRARDKMSELLRGNNVRNDNEGGVVRMWLPTMLSGGWRLWCSCKNAGVGVTMHDDMVLARQRRASFSASL